MQSNDRAHAGLLIIITLFYVLEPRQLSAYDGIVDTYIKNIFEKRHDTFMGGFHGSFGWLGFEVLGVTSFGQNTFRRSCPISIFRSAISQTGIASTYLRACGTAGPIGMVVYIKRKSNHFAVSFCSAILGVL